MIKWIKVRRKVVKTFFYAGHGSAYGLSSEVNTPPSWHIWLECGHQRAYNGYKNEPKTLICHKCSYRKEV